MVGPRVLFVPGANPEATFVRHDLNLLQGRFAVEVLAWPSRPSQRLRTLARAVLLIATRRVDGVFIWFAAVSYAPWITLAARLRHVPVVIVTGGADVANQPEIEFGDARVWWRRRLVARTLTRATLTIPFSEAARREVLAIAPCARVHVIAPAVVMPVCTGEAALRERLVLTVSAVTRLTLAQKGLDTFVRCAATLPDARFVIAGRLAEPAAVEKLRALASSNVEFVGAISDAELHRLYCRARVYAQLSSHEGFGVAVVEAMAAGCHVVATNRGSLPEVVGARGRYVPYGDVEASARAIADALEAEPAQAIAPQLQMRYGSQQRGQQLDSALTPLFAGRHGHQVGAPGQTL